jgi:hypothetical protein
VGRWVVDYLLTLLRADHGVHRLTARLATEVVEGAPSHDFVFPLLELVPASARVVVTDEQFRLAERLQNPGAPNSTCRIVPIESPNLRAIGVPGGRAIIRSDSVSQHDGRRRAVRTDVSWRILLPSFAEFGLLFDAASDTRLRNAMARATRRIVM